MSRRRNDHRTEPSTVNKETPKMPPHARLLTLIVLAIGLMAPAAAHAAPTFGVDLEQDINEVQRVVVEATGGQFKLRFGGDTTTDLGFEASSASVQAALNALPSINAGGGSVSVESITGEYLITFGGGPLAGTDVSRLTAVKGTTPLSGGLHKVIAWTMFHSGIRRGDERLEYVLRVKNTGADPTSGTVTAEIEMPGGLDTSVIKTVGAWSCAKAPPAGVQPAKATCTSSASVAPGASYPSLAISAKLGTDAPDHAVATATVSGGGAVTASDSEEFDFGPPTPFGINSFDSEVSDANGNDYTQAGGHPYAGSESFSFNAFRENDETGGNKPPISAPVAQIKTIGSDLARGFVGNALAVPELCPSTADVLASTCPPGAAVGQIALDVNIGGNLGATKVPVYSIVPEYGLPAQFAFAEVANLKTVFTIAPHLRADDGYAISLVATPAPVWPPLRSVPDITLCGFGAKVSSSNKFEGCKKSTDPTANPLPLITNPTRCTGTLPTVGLEIDSWLHPGDFAHAETTDPLPTGCDQVPFEPKVKLEPTSHEADSPTGVNVEITMPTHGVEDPEDISQAMLDNATVTFPKGMSINPASAHGLAACTLAQLKFHSNEEDQCPESSKVGTVEVDTPIISSTLTGDVYVASQKDNPFNSTLGLYMVFDSKKDGTIVKVAGKLVPDPVTGQITSVFTENPEWPFSRVSLRFPQGPRSPLINPPKCGTYAIHSEMSPWSAVNPANPTADEIVAEDSEFKVTNGPGGRPCPTGALDPKLDAGVSNPQAGAKSPFVLKLSREDGSERFSALGVTMPPGLVASLKGVPYCPNSVLAGISAAELTGRGEQANPACPAASQVGTVSAGAGAGLFPFYVPGRAYLAGPYKGAPLSIAIVTPAVAGPFDLGNVVVRNAVYVDPVTTQVRVVSDPIPTIMHGVLLDVRDVRVNIDRPDFIVAPTDCESSTIDVLVAGEAGSSATRSNRFQVDGCEKLGFRPKLDLRLFGGTKRGSHPRLQATLTARPGDANIAGASVALPHSEFLDQSHIRTVCTRVQFAAEACPPGAIYGEAEAITPLLDNPLSGLVYLRSSDNPLPDLVVALKGPDSQPIEVVLAGRIDSIHGGIRNTFDVVPDVPVTSFTLKMQGGKKGLLVNSRNICKPVNRATVKFSAQNGRESTLRPKLQNSCGEAAKKAKRRSAH
jgi:hypothetical protein